MVTTRSKIVGNNMWHKKEENKKSCTRMGVVLQQKMTESEYVNMFVLYSFAAFQTRSVCIIFSLNNFFCLKKCVNINVFFQFSILEMR